MFLLYTLCGGGSCYKGFCCYVSMVNKNSRAIRRFVGKAVLLGAASLVASVASTIAYSKYRPATGVEVTHKEFRNDPGYNGMEYRAGYVGALVGLSVLALGARPLRKEGKRLVEALK